MMTMTIAETLQKQASCKVCGAKVPAIKRMSISMFNSFQCPNCGSHMTYSKHIFIIQLGMFIAIFPVLSMIFNRNQYAIGSFLLLLLIVLLLVVTYTAKFRIQGRKSGPR